MAVATAAGRSRCTACPAPTTIRTRTLGLRIMSSTPVRGWNRAPWAGSALSTSVGTTRRLMTPVYRHGVLSRRVRATAVASAAFAAAATAVRSRRSQVGCALCTARADGGCGGLGDLLGGAALELVVGDVERGVEQHQAAREPAAGVGGQRAEQSPEAVSHHEVPAGAEGKHVGDVVGEQVRVGAGARPVAAQVGGDHLVAVRGEGLPELPPGGAGRRRAVQQERRTGPGTPAGGGERDGRRWCGRVVWTFVPHHHEQRVTTTCIPV